MRAMPALALSPLLLLAVGGCGASAPATGQGLPDGQLGTSDQANDQPALAEEEPHISAEAFQKATWVVLASNNEGVFQATAFAVAPNLLVTNAHVCNGILDVMSAIPSESFVIQHETGIIHSIVRVWLHPAYDPLLPPFQTPDVGVLQVDGELMEKLTLAEPADLRSLEIFDQISLCGFPGELFMGIDIPDLSQFDVLPRASCLQGQISALRPLLAGLPAQPENTLLVQYDLPVTPGTSGSAVIGPSGAVIGVHHAGFPGTDYTFAMRADLVEELLDLIQTGVMHGTYLDLDLRPLPTEIEIDSTMRASCPGYPDSSLLAIINTLGRDWWEGETKQEALSAANAVCVHAFPSDFDRQLDCYECRSAIVDAVWP